MSPIDPKDHQALMQISFEHIDADPDDEDFVQNVAEYLCQFYEVPSPELVQYLAEYWLKPVHHFKKWTTMQIFTFSLSSLNSEKVKNELQKPRQK